MTWRKHPRHLTDEQFADETTIDGNRLDTAMADIVRRFNAVEKGDIATRFVQTQYVAGWSPQTTAADHHWPWLQGVNFLSGTQVAGALPSTIANQYRTKGYQTPGMDVLSLATGYIYTWSTSYYFHKPGVLTDLVILMQTDAVGATSREYTNTFKYGSTPPEGFAEHDGNKDICVSVSADSPFSPEDRAQNNVLVHRAAFDMAREWTNGIRFNGTITDMEPADPPWADADQGGIWGMCLPLRDLNVPIPRDTRLRIDIVIPKYGAATDGGWGDANPWAKQRMDMTLTVLEEIED